MVRGLRRAAWLGASMIAVSLAPVGAVAQREPSPAAIAAARELFAEARKLEDQGKWEEALEKLRAVGSVKMTPQVRFHIGLCLEKIGSLVAALNAFEKARQEASEQGVQQVVAEASEHAAALRPRLPKVRLSVAEKVPGLAVSIDAEPVALDLIGAPMPIDPGNHGVDAKAPGYRPFTKMFVAVEGKEAPVDIVLVQDPTWVGPAGTTAPAATASARPGVPGGPEAGPGAAGGGGSRTAAWALLGVGAASLGGAAYFAIARGGAVRDIDDACPSHQDCDPALEDTRKRAARDGALAVALGGVGVAAAAAGVVLLATGKREAPRGTGGVQVVPAVGPGRAEIAGTWRW